MIPCDACRAGWVMGREWAEQCPVCGGRGELTFYALSGILGEDERSIRRVYEMAPRVRTRTFRRVFNAVARVLA